MNRGMDEKEWLQRIADLPREIAPRRDPWPDISARIGSRARPGARSRWPWSVAAAVLLAVTAGWLFIQAPGVEDRPYAPRVAVEAPEPVPQAAAGALPAAVEASEVEYQAAFREFIPLGQAREGLQQQTVERLEAGWAELQHAEQALTAALTLSPGDPFLNGRMLELRARQLGFLRQLAALEQDYRRLTI